MSSICYVNTDEWKQLANKVTDFFEPKAAKPSAAGQAVAAGARWLYLDLQKRIPVGDETAKNPGLLKESAYRFYDDSISPDSNHVYYQVGVNIKIAPHFHLAEKGHKFYQNYLPMKFIRKGKVAEIRSRKKTSGVPLGPPVFSATPRWYLRDTFTPTHMSKAISIIHDTYFNLFKKSWNS